MDNKNITLEVDEAVIKIIHRHWIILFVQVFFLAVVALAPLFLITAILVTPALMAGFGNTLVANGPYVLFFYLTWLLFLWMALSQTILNHFLDVWIITDRRIIAIDQRGFFRRHMGSFRLDKLQDVNTEVTGIIATLFDYGTVEAETASGSTGEFRAHNLPNPRTIKDTILQLVAEQKN